VDEDSGETVSKTFNQHWGWFATIYQLSKSDILKVTGDTSITKLNFIFCLNYLGIESDWNQEMIKEQKRAEREARQKVRLR